jgi:antitoxin ParD1/3/4
MARNTSISLGDHFEKFIQHEVTSGRYGSVSEVIRTALRLLESEEQKLEALRLALDEGEQSEFIQNFDPEQHLKSLHLKVK